MIIKKNQEEIQNYLFDASNFKGFCDAVYFPESADDISQILKDANQNGISVTISGNGTGLTGARVPQGGIVISTEKLNKVVEINEDEKYIIVEPGVILADLQEALKTHNLIYPPDPTDENCFIGGTMATNASGEKTFEYGPTRDFVLELEIVLANGEKLTLRRGQNFAQNSTLTLTSEEGTKYVLDVPETGRPNLKNASGYFCRKNMDAIDLFIGSEGTLGVISRAKLKLIDSPSDIISCIAFFDDEASALNFIESARDKSFKSRSDDKNYTIDALALEFFDKNSLDFLREDFTQIPSSVNAAVWFEQEIYQDKSEEEILDQWLEIIMDSKGKEEYSWFGITEKDKKEIEFMRKTLPRKVNEYIFKNNFRKLGTDTAVPHDKFREFYQFSKNEVAKDNIEYVIFGHVGNSHIHLNMLPKNQEEFDKAGQIYKTIVDKAIAMGGTFSAEHGVGKVKKDYLLKMFGEETIKKMAAIKSVLDPKWILGRGNIFDNKIAEGVR